MTSHCVKPFTISHETHEADSGEKTQSGHCETNQHISTCTFAQEMSHVCAIQPKVPGYHCVYPSYLKKLMNLTYCV